MACGSFMTFAARSPSSLLTRFTRPALTMLFSLPSLSMDSFELLEFVILVWVMLSPAT